MMRNTKLWLWISALFTIVNVGGGYWAARLGELNHAGVHALLTALGIYAFWRLKQRVPAPEVGVAHVGDRRLEELQRSVDAVAIEVERIGEAQRFQTKLAAKEPSPLRSPED